MFTIVKNAAATHWDHFFVENPEDGVGLFLSAHGTYSGEQCGLKETYTDPALAEADCKKINIYNPSGGYAVCKVKE
jgi:hypothetical protein